MWSFSAVFPFDLLFGIPRNNLGLSTSFIPRNKICLSTKSFYLYFPVNLCQRQIYLTVELSIIFQNGDVYHMFALSLMSHVLCSITARNSFCLYNMHILCIQNYQTNVLCTSHKNICIKVPSNYQPGRAIRPNILKACSMHYTSNTFSKTAHDSLQC